MRNLPYIIAVFIGGVALNLAGAGLMQLLRLPLYLDCVGTLLAAALGGIMPGVLVGYISNVIGGITNPTDIYFALTSVLIALAAGYLYERGYFKRIGGCVTAVLLFSLMLSLAAVFSGDPETAASAREHLDGEWFSDRQAPASPASDI